MDNLSSQAQELYGNKSNQSYQAPKLSADELCMKAEYMIKQSDTYKQIGDLQNALSMCNQAIGKLIFQK